MMGRLKRRADEVKGFLGVTSVDVIPTKARMLTPGVGDGRREVIARSQVMFKGERLYIPKRCSGFRLLDLRVGNESVFFSSTETPAEAFAQCRDGSLYTLMSKRLDDAMEKMGDGVRRSEGEADIAFEELDDENAQQVEETGEPLGMPTCPPMLDIRFFVVNEGEPARFDAILFGKALR